MVRLLSALFVCGTSAFEIVNVNSHMCLDITGASCQSSTNVEQWQCNDGSNQQWRFANGRIESVGCPGQCLDCYGPDYPQDEDNLQIYPCHGRANQQWRVASDHRTIINPQSGKCIDIYGESHSAGANAQLYHCHGSANQKWEKSGPLMNITATNLAIRVKGEETVDFIELGEAEGMAEGKASKAEGAPTNVMAEGMAERPVSRMDLTLFAALFFVVQAVTLGFVIRSKNLALKGYVAA